MTQVREPAVHYKHTEIGYNYRKSNVVAEDVLLALKAANVEFRAVWKPMHLHPVYLEYEAIRGAAAEGLF